MTVPKLNNANFVLAVWILTAVPAFVISVSLILAAKPGEAAQALAGIFGGIAGYFALGAAYFTVKEIRRQTERPIKDKERDTLLTQIANIEALRFELRITSEGLTRLQNAADGFSQDIDKARRYMPIWLYFPKVLDLRETTIAEIGVDFRGKKAAQEFTLVRESLRVLMRLNYTIHRDAIETLPDSEILDILRNISKTCDTAKKRCYNFRKLLSAMRSSLKAELKALEADIQKMHE